MVPRNQSILENGVTLSVICICIYTHIHSYISDLKISYHFLTNLASLSRFEDS